MNTETMSVVKNKSTDRDREFWSHVEAVASQARRIRALTCPQSPNSAPDHEGSTSETSSGGAETSSNSA